ncbi:MAG: ribonuclease [Geminicoccaceae bacterium]|nr:ribonuclease [Geminicoccaceae bacterium]
MQRASWVAVFGLGVAVATCGPARAFEPLQGCFVADAVCPAVSSIRRASNPGELATEAGRAYPLLGANRKERASHVQIRVPDAQPPERWVALGCGHPVPTCAPGEAGPVPDGATGGSDYVLAASWQPAFCERHRVTPECRSQTPERFDALNLALHGLWPEPRANVYCGVSRAQRAADEAGRWDELPAPDLTDRTLADLATVMPGTRSALHRHEWLKHGTCYGASSEEYFADSLQLMAELNASAVRRLLAARIGARVTAQQVRAAFDQAFGAGTGARVALDCAGGLITELQIHLRGAIEATTRLADLLAAAAPVDAGCPGGRIDPAGFDR